MTKTKARYLTKSRFKLAVECPTKLNYISNENYANKSNENEFLKALAEGGHQVGELAKLMFTGGIDVTTLDHKDALERTLELLKLENVTIFEAAIRHENFFIRIDVLRKTGNHFDLIEVKAKSFDSTEENTFIAPKGGIDGGYLSYLQDIAFQKYVLACAYPDFTINASLMMADKSKRCSVDGLNQCFEIKRDPTDPKKVEVKPAPHVNKETIGDPILGEVNVDECIDLIWKQELSYAGKRGGVFDKFADEYGAAYVNNEKIPPMVGAQCAKCEFKTDVTIDEKRSGFHECWAESKKLNPEDIAGGTVLDLYNFRRKQDLLDENIYLLSDVTEENIRLEISESAISSTHRQWMQASGEWLGEEEFYLVRDHLQAEMQRWVYPFHFIDFETSRPAIPFHNNRRPYEQIGFQFSHHVMRDNGTISHEDEFISVEPGIFPNYDFVRALMAALNKDKGTVFIWSPHENTVLNDIYDQLEVDPYPPADAQTLKDFIFSLTVKKDERKKIIRQGDRVMYDLCKLAKACFFHPSTNGSSSIKKVLPAVLQSSGFLRERYSKPIYGTQGGIPSKNFPEGQTWWQEDGSSVKDPYSLLPPIFNDISQEQVDAFTSHEEVKGNERIAEGGAAMTAYARLQYNSTSKEMREHTKAALLRYCELDTLAMVMILEAWKDWLGRK